MQDLNKRIEEKLSSSKVLTYMKKFLDKVAVYPESVMDFGKTQSNLPYYRYHIKNDKRKKVIEEKAEQMYKYHNIFQANCHDLKGTVVLQGTNTSIPFYINESANFAAHLDYFNNKLKEANSVQELSLYYKDTFNEKVSDILPLLLDDLFALSSKYNLEIDKLTIINQYKEQMAKEKERLLELEKKEKERLLGKTK